LAGDHTSELLDRPIDLLFVEGGKAEEQGIDVFAFQKEAVEGDRFEDLLQRLFVRGGPGFDLHMGSDI
jgi:hypothetical protein